MLVFPNKLVSEDLKRQFAIEMKKNLAITGLAQRAFTRFNDTKLLMSDHGHEEHKILGASTFSTLSSFCQ